MQLQTKLFIALIALALSPLVLFGAIAYSASTRSLDQVARNDLKGTADSVNRALALLEHNLGQAVYDNSLWDELHAAISTDTLDNEFLNTNFGANGTGSEFMIQNLNALGIWDKTGTKPLYLVGTVGFITQAAPHFIETVAAKNGLSTSFVNTEQGIFMISAAPVMTSAKTDPNGVMMFARLLGVDDLNQIKAVTGHEVALYNGVRQLATTLTGNFIASSNDLKNAANGEQVLNLNDANTGLVYQPIKTENGSTIGTLVIWESLSAIMAAQTSISGTLLPAFLVTVLVSILVAIFLRNSIARPLIALADTADRIAAGDLTQRVITPSSGDELGRLANAFNQMATGLDRRVNASETENARLQSIDEYRLNLLTDITLAMQTPIKQIQNHSQILINEMYGTLNDAQRKSIGVVRRAVNVQQVLLAELLDFARVQGKQIRFDRQPFALATLVDDVYNQVDERFQDKRITFTRLIPPGLPNIYADQTRFEQVIEKLLEWSFALSKLEGVVQMEAIPARHGVTIAISQFGNTLSVEQQAHIFDLFYRQDLSAALPTSARANEGLGLALVKALVEQQGGSIALGDMPESGNQFVLTMPASLN